MSSASPEWRRSCTATPKKSERRFRFFGGKGGVGKTTCAAAYAVLAARESGSALALSVDPAHSLGDAFDAELEADPIELAKGLFAAELDAGRALQRWLGEKKGALRIAAERGTYLDRKEIDELLEQSLPGVDELVGLVEISRTSREHRAIEVIVDAAPTGHTLRLLEMPETLVRVGKVFDAMLKKHRFLAETLGGKYSPDAVDRMISSIGDEASALQDLLRDPERCRFTWVTIPEALAVEETKDGIAALEALGITVDEVVINRLTPAKKNACSLCRARVQAERAALAPLSRIIGARAVRVVPVLPSEPRGIAALRKFAAVFETSGALPPPARASSRVARPRAARAMDAGVLETLVPESAELVIVGGKGGVGKTTIAAASAIAAARRDPKKRVLVLSIDPAHSLGDAFGVKLGDVARAIPGAPKNLLARELDAPAVFQAKRDHYQDAVDEMFEKLRGASRFDIAYDRAVLRDLFDLAPPGIDELFAVLGVIEALLAKKRKYDLLVVDTAPTGHALRFLELPAEAREWVHVFMRIVLEYREVIGLGELAEELLDTAKELRALEELLHDPARARFVAVTRATALARLETARLLDALDELEIAAGALVVNATVPEKCECVAGERKIEAREVRLLRRDAAAHDIPVLEVPRAAVPPRGVAALEKLGATIVEVE